MGSCVPACSSSSNNSLAIGLGVGLGVGIPIILIILYFAVYRGACSMKSKITAKPKEAEVAKTSLAEPPSPPKEEKGNHAPNGGGDV